MCCNRTTNNNKASNTCASYISSCYKPDTLIQPFSLLLTLSHDQHAQYYVT